MNPLKTKLGLDTDTGTDLKSAVYAVAGVIVTMDPGWDRTWLLTVFLIVMAIINYLTVGSGSHKYAPPDDTTIEEALRRARQ